MNILIFVRYCFRGAFLLLEIQLNSLILELMRNCFGPKGISRTLNYRRLKTRIF